MHCSYVTWLSHQGCLLGAGSWQLVGSSSAFRGPCSLWRWGQGESCRRNEIWFGIQCELFGIRLRTYFACVAFVPIRNTEKERESQMTLQVCTGKGLSTDGTTRRAMTNHKIVGKASLYFRFTVTRRVGSAFITKQLMDSAYEKSGSVCWCAALITPLSSYFYIQARHIVHFAPSLALRVRLKSMVTPFPGQFYPQPSLSS